MRSIFSVLFFAVCLQGTAQVGENDDALGVQIAGSMLMLSDCCHESLQVFDPIHDLGYRISVLSRHTSGGRFYHDFQLSYSRERIGYSKDRNGDISEEYIDYEAYHFIYYFGLKPIKTLPVKLFIGHNVGQIAHNFGNGVEAELFGLNLKAEFTIELPYDISLEPVVDYSYTYNKTEAYNHRLVFGFNCLKRI